MTSKSLLVFLHGSGCTGMELRQFLSVCPISGFEYKTFRQMAIENRMDILAPTADKMRYSPMGNQTITAWFNRSPACYSKGVEDTYEDIESVEKSLAKVLSLIEEKEHEYDHIFLGGHSMGGCLSLYGLRKELNPKIRGIFSMGSFLIDKSVVFDKKVKLPSSSLPVFMMHGMEDSVINHEWGKHTATSLLLLGIRVRFESYDKVDHDIGEGSLLDLMDWIVDLRETADKAAGRVEAEPEDPDDAAWEQVEAESLFQRPPSQHKANWGSDASSGIEFIIEYNAFKLNEAVLRFPIPTDIAHQLIPLLTARPVLACGGMFDMVADSTGTGVMTTVESSDPERLGKEIAKRLAIRITSGGGSLNACPMS